MAMYKRKLSFGISYKKLFDVGIEKITLLHRDQAELASRGITAARIAAFEAQMNAYVNLPSNVNAVAHTGLFMRDRKASLLQLKLQVKEIWGIAKNTFGSRTAEYKIFGTCNISQLGVLAIITVTNKTIIAAQRNMVAMQPKGLTAAMISNLQASLTAFETNAVAVNTAKGSRGVVVQQRQDAANSLFSELTNMCNTANVYYTSRNKLKAKQYIIYSSVGKLQQRNGAVAVQQVVYRELKMVSPKSKLLIKVLAGSELEFYFSKNKQGSIVGKKMVVQANMQHYVKGTAGSLGFNKSNGFVHFCIKNALPNGIESKYSVKMQR